MLNVSKSFESEFSNVACRRAAVIVDDYEAYPYFGCRERQLEAHIEDLICGGLTGSQDVQEYVEEQDLENSYDWRTAEQWVVLIESSL